MGFLKKWWGNKDRETESWGRRAGEGRGGSYEEALRISKVLEFY